MKQINKTLLLLIFVIISCKKEGKEGPQGEQGPIGATGPDAKSVIINAWFDSTNEYYHYSIWQDGYNQGDAVIVYFENPSISGFYIQTPYLWYNSTNNPVAYFFVEIASASIFIHAQKPNNPPYTSAFSTYTNHKFKAVIIKSKAMKEHPNVNLSDFEEVKRTFKIIE